MRPLSVKPKLLSGHLLNIRKRFAHAIRGYRREILVIMLRVSIETERQRILRSKVLVENSCPFGDTRSIRLQGSSVAS